MSKDQQIQELEEATSELLNYAYELTYLLEHFSRKSNKTTSLDVRNHIRNFKSISNNFKSASIKVFSDKNEVDQIAG